MNLYSEISTRLKNGGWKCIKTGNHEKWVLGEQLVVLPANIQDHGRIKYNTLADIERRERAHRNAHPEQPMLPFIEQREPEMEPSPKVNHPLPMVTHSKIADAEVNTVNARDLHAFLGIGKDFSNWVKDQVIRARLVENRDFIKVAQKGEHSGQNRIDYYLTFDAAKQIGMMCGTDKGFEIREYFIECERKAVKAMVPVNPFMEMDQEQMMEFALIKVREGKEKDKTISYQAEVIEYKDLVIKEKDEELEIIEGMVVEREHTINVLDTTIDAIATKTIGSLQQEESAKYFKVKRTWFLRWLKKIKWVFKNAQGHSVAYAQVMEAGWMEHKIQTYENGTFYPMVLITPSGLFELGKMIAQLNESEIEKSA